MKQSVITWIQQIPLGNELTPEKCERLVNLASMVERQEGETLFREGEKHDVVYWILDGCVSLEMSTGRAAPKTLLTLHQGDLVAWSAMVRGGRMTSTAKTTVATRLLAFDAKALQQLCRSDHEIGYHVMEDIACQLASRLLATRLQMLDMFSHPSDSNP